MTVLRGTFTRRIYSCYSTEYHVLSFLDDIDGLVTVVYKGESPPAIDDRTRVTGRFKISSDYGERFIMSSYQMEGDRIRAEENHGSSLASIMNILET